MFTEYHLKSRESGCEIQAFKRSVIKRIRAVAYFMGQESKDLANFSHGVIGHAKQSAPFLIILECIFQGE